MTMNIPVYTEINDFYKAIGSSNRTKYSDFDMTRLELMNLKNFNSFKEFKNGFYHITFIKSGRNGSPNNLKFCAPGQITPYQIPTISRGFWICFKPEFINTFSDIKNEFIFFNGDEVEPLQISHKEEQVITDYFEKIFEEFKSTNPYKMHTIKFLFCSLLYYCKSLYELNVMP